MKICETCRQQYDANDLEAVSTHTEPVNCGSSDGRCNGKPSCYDCKSSFCFCTSH